MGVTSDHLRAFPLTMKLQWLSYALGAARCPLWAVSACSAAALLLSACGPGVMIDYVDFVRLNGIEYVAGPERGLPPLPEAALGPAAGKVNKQLAGHVSDPSYGPRDGDAGLLESGTTLYSVKGSKVASVWPPTGLSASSSTRRTLTRRRSWAPTCSMFRAR